MSFFEANKLLREVIHKLWPDYQADEKFIPSSDLRFGDAVSACPQNLGKFLRRSPVSVAQTIIDNLPQEFPGECHEVNGFLNVSLNYIFQNWDDRKRVFAELYKIDSAKLRIVLPSFTKYAAADEFFRLSALAVCQLMLSRISNLNSELYIGSDLVCGDTEPISLAKIYAKIISSLQQAEVPSFAETRDILERLLKNEFQGRTSLWLAPTSLDKGAFNSLYKGIIRNSSTLSLHCPPRFWLTGCDDISDLSDNLESWREKDLAALSLYLAGVKQGVELQLMSAKFEESDNLLWLIHSLWQRIQKYDFKREVLRLECQQPLSNRLSLVLKKGAFLAFFRQAGGCNGSVCDYVKVLSEFLNGLLMLIGDPDLRRRMAEDKLRQVEIEILTGAELVLSDTISDWNGWINIK